MQIQQQLLEIQNSYLGHSWRTLLEDTPVGVTNPIRTVPELVCILHFPPKSPQCFTARAVKKKKENLTPSLLAICVFFFDRLLHRGGGPYSLSPTGDKMAGWKDRKSQKQQC